MIIAFIQKYALLGLGGALALSLAAVGVQTVRHQSALTELSKVREQHATEALDATNRVRVLEARLAAQAKENQDALLAEKNRTRSAAAGFAAERTRLRTAIEKFASGSGLAPDVAAATCSERASALGRGLDETLRAEESLVEQLEDQRADTRTLLRDAQMIRQR